MTLQQAAQTALDCQDASNLSGVLASFKAIVHEVLWPEARRLGKGTDWVNEHPIVALFLDKLVDLNRYGRRDTVWYGEGNAHDQVRLIASGEADLKAHPEKASVTDCYACGLRIGDAAYTVNADNLPRHAVCPCEWCGSDEPHVCKERV